ncbi:hypothetical protein HI914_06935 [Erysiphe necator]|nr:hypothetical protein HI914_06935 [Erysiphe necator]
MAKSNSNGAINGKGGFFKSPSAFPNSLSQRSQPSAAQETEPKTTHKVQQRESQVSRRDSSMNFKNIFCRAKSDNVDNCSMTPISEDVQFSDRNKGVSGGSITGFAKTMALKGSFTSKDFDESAHSNLLFSGPYAKKISLAYKNSRSSSLTSSAKPISLKIMKHPECQSSTWQAPSLNQAYPQSIKHSRLSASTLSADAIIRVESNRRSNSVRESFAKFDAILRQSQPHNNSNNLIENTNFSTPHSHHRRKSSKNVTSAEWTQKIFVLVTSGYLLQYSGSGRNDRMPEKILQLGKDSVAFASDAIPGKHWVLQVSQSMSPDGTSTPNCRSLLSRINFRAMDHRKIAKSLLLVFDNADDLESWIYTLRREIKILGGRLSDSDNTRYYQKDKPLPSPKKPCQRFILQDADGCSPNSSTLPLMGPKLAEDDIRLRSKSESEGRTLFRHHSVATIRSSIGNYSTTNSIFSLDARRLGSLNGSHNRSSFMSSGQRTMITSQSSSARSSPVLSAFDDHNSKCQTDETTFFKPTPDFIHENGKASPSETDKLPESVYCAFQGSQVPEHRRSLPTLVNEPPSLPPPRCALPPIPPRNIVKRSRGHSEISSMNFRAVSGGYI